MLTSLEIVWLSGQKHQGVSIKLSLSHKLFERWLRFAMKIAMQINPAGGQLVDCLQQLGVSGITPLLG